MIREDPEGTLWIGTLEGGLNRFKSGRFTAYTTAQGLRSNDVSAILTDGQYVWVGTLDGSLHLVRSDRALALPAGRRLERPRAADPRRRARLAVGERSARHHPLRAGRSAEGRQRRNAVAATPRVFDHSDGFGRWEFHGASQSAGVRRADGRWSLRARPASSSSAEASHVARSCRRCTCARCSSTAGERRSRDELVLPAGQNQLEFHYTALSYAVPSRVTFRYQLEGVDAGWIDAGTRRVAYYTNVPRRALSLPRHRRQHRRRLEPAAARRSPWRVGSPFWETSWFYGLGGVGLVVARRRVCRGCACAAARRASARCASIVDERTAALSQEIDERQRIEASLRKSRDELEDRVRERTTELRAALAQLQQDVARAPQARRAARAGAEAREHRPPRRRRRARHQQRADGRPQLLRSGRRRPRRGASAAGAAPADSQGRRARLEPDASSAGLRAQADHRAARHQPERADAQPRRHAAAPDRRGRRARSPSPARTSGR